MFLSETLEPNELFTDRNLSEYPADDIREQRVLGFMSVHKTWPLHETDTK